MISINDAMGDASGQFASARNAVSRAHSCGAVADDDLVEAPAGPPPALRARLRRIQRLCRGLDLDVFAGSIVVDLLEKIDEMERDLERLRALTQPREK